MSSLVKIAKIAPSASIVYQFLVFLLLFWDLQNLSQKVHVLDKVETRGVEREETEVNLAIALLLTVLLIFVG